VRNSLENFDETPRRMLGRRKAAGTAAVFGKTAFAGFVQEG